MVNNKAIRQALYTCLNVSAVNQHLATSNGASIVHSVAPQESAYPLLVFFKTSAIQVGVFAADGTNAHSTQRDAGYDANELGEAYRDHIWTVKGVARGTRSGQAEDIDHAAYQLLQYGDVTIAGADLMLITRIGDVEYTEVVGDTQYRHCGGNYRLVIQDAPPT